MDTREYLDEQLVAQETATNRRALSTLRAAYRAKGMTLSEAQAVRMCIRAALPELEAATPAALEVLAETYKVLPGAKRDEPLDEQLVVQETASNRARLTAVSDRYNADRKGNARLLEAPVIRLCIALALPGLLRDAGAKG